MKRINLKPLLVGVIAIAMGLIVGAVIIAIMGRNPLTVYYNLLQGCGLAPKKKYAGGRSMLTDFFSYIDYATPMIFAALAVCVALKTGLFNIGVSGQMLFGAFLATVTVGYSDLPAIVAKPLVILISMMGAALMGMLIGFLKFRFNISEVVSSIMLNYIAEYVISFFINTKFVDPVSRQSREVSQASRLTLSQVSIGGYKYDLAIGFLLAIAAVVLIYLLMEKTVLGFELKAVGLGREAARYAGIPVGRNMMLSMAISGALAGLAGATLYLGHVASIQPKVLTSVGFDAIAVCLVGAVSPVGILIATFVLEIVSNGATYMSSQSKLESEIASVIMGLILLTSACSAYIMSLINKKNQEEKVR